MTGSTQTLEPHATLSSFLEHMGRIEASDLYLVAGSPPVFRVNDVTYTGRVALEVHEIVSMADSLMSVNQRQEFRSSLEMNLTFSSTDAARFRVNLFWQRGTPAMVVRSLQTSIKTLDELGHPPVLKDLALARHGLVLLVGRRASGISTTLAAMIDHRNTAQTGHILTLEDPIEFVHSSKQCVVTQREVGVDTRSYADALRNVLRQTPDMIVIDSIRAAETLEYALAAADSGHLCVSTLHAGNVVQAIHRLLSLFAPARHAEILLRLSLALRGVVAQRLIPALRAGRVAALELLLDVPRVKDVIKSGKIEGLEEAMAQDDVGGCTFDAALIGLLRAGRVSETEALKAADNPRDFQLRIRRSSEQGGAAGAARETPVPLRLAPDSPARPGPAVPTTTSTVGHR